MSLFCFLAPAASVYLEYKLLKVKNLVFSFSPAHALYLSLLGNVQYMQDGWMGGWIDRQIDDFSDDFQLRISFIGFEFLMSHPDPSM